MQVMLVRSLEQERRVAVLLCIPMGSTKGFAFVDTAAVHSAPLFIFSRKEASHAF